MFTMSKLSSRLAQGVASAAVAIALTVPASAQQQPDARQVLGQAEAQSARRSANDFLSGLLGASQARAQTAPANPAPQAQGTAGAPPATPGIATTAPTTSGPAQAPIRTAQNIPQPLPPAVEAPAAGNGTPTDPTMIVRVPAPTTNEPATAVSPPSPAQSTTTAGRPVPLDPLAPAQPTSAAVSASPGATPSATVTAGTPDGTPVARALISQGPAARPVRILVAGQRRAWCPPGWR